MINTGTRGFVKCCDNTGKCDPAARMERGAPYGRPPGGIMCVGHDREQELAS